VGEEVEKRVFELIGKTAVEQSGRLHVHSHAQLKRSKQRSIGRLTALKIDWRQNQSVNRVVNRPDEYAQRHKSN